MDVPGLISMALFYGAVLCVGLYASRKSMDSSDSGLLLADRRLPLFLGVFTMTATWVGGGYINGTAEAVYDSGLGLFWCQAPWGYALSLIVGGLFFAKPMRRAGYTTLLDPFEERYGKRGAAGLFVPALMGEIFWSAAILAALGMTFSTLLGIDVRVSILISAAVAVGYTMVGGLWSVVWTDLIQLICILGGLVLVIPFAAEHSGGVQVAVSSYLERQAARDPFPGFALWRWLDIGLMLIMGGIPWQVYFQRVLACRDERASVRLSVIAGVGCALMAIPAVLIGMIGATADWSAAGVQPPEVASMVLPEVIHYLTPALVATIALGAVAAAVMSSIDSSILSASTMFAWNVYRPLLRPGATYREVRRVTRVAVVLIGAAAAVLALTVQSVYVLWYLCAELVYVVLFPQLTLVLFFPRAHRWAAFVGVVVGVLLRLGGGEQSLGLDAWIPYPMDGDFPFRTVAMLANLGTTWCLSLLWTKSDTGKRVS